MKFTNFEAEKFDGEVNKFDADKPPEYKCGKCDFCGGYGHLCSLRKISVEYNIGYTGRNPKTEYICYQCAAKNLLIAQKIVCDGWIHHILNVEELGGLILERNSLDLYNYEYTNNGHGPFGFVEKFVDYYYEHHCDKVHKLLEEYICDIVVPEWLKSGNGQET